MNLKAPHRWNLSAPEARAVQERLASRVVRHDDLPPIRSVAGVDVGFEDNGRITRAAVAVLSFPGLQPVTHAIARRKTTFPYIPGLLSFREIPAVLAALRRLTIAPDLLLCDGQGYAHPRRFGIACHLGVITGLASIGVAKTRLIGEYALPANRKGAWTALTQNGEIIGAVLRTRESVKPLFISTGHRVGLESSIAYTLACTPRYRLPETTRRAHALASG